MQKVYKNYYCGTCFALQFHYGQLSRLLLSYDITIFAIIIKAHQNPTCDRLKCYGQTKCKKRVFMDNEWKKIAALNLLIAAENLRDDIEDNKSIKAYIANAIFGRVFKKAKKDFPEMAQCISAGYKEILEAEKDNRSLMEIAECFGKMMINTVESSFSMDETKKLFVREISRWLYVIDALDDYNKDAKKGDFNPIVQKNLSFKGYVNSNYSQIQAFITDLRQKYSEFNQKFSNGCVEEQILCSIINDTIPTNTSMVLNEVQKQKRVQKLGSVWRKVL